jgi:hypothetical protein
VAGNEWRVALRELGCKSHRTLKAIVRTLDFTVSNEPPGNIGKGRT